MSGAGLIELLAARLGGRGARRAAPALREALAEVSARGANQSDPLVTVYRGGGDGQFWTPNAETAAGYGPVRRGMLDTNGFGSAEYTAEMANQSDDFGAFIQNQMARAESENLPGVTLDGIPDLPNWDIQRQYIVRDPSRLRDIAEHGPASEAAPSLRDALSKINASRTGPDAGPVQGESGAGARFRYVGESRFGNRNYRVPLRDGIEAELKISPEGGVSWGLVSEGGDWRGLSAAERSDLGLRAMRGVQDALVDDAAKFNVQRYGFEGSSESRNSLYQFLTRNADQHGFTVGENNGLMELRRSFRTAPDGGPVQRENWTTLYRGSDTDGAFRERRWGTPDRMAARDYGANVTEFQGNVADAPQVRMHDDLRRLLGDRADELMATRRADVWEYLDDPAVQQALRQQGVSVVRVSDDLAPNPSGNWRNDRYHESYLILDESRIRTAPNAGPAQTVGALPSATSEGVTTYRGENTHVRIQPFPRRGVTEVTWDVNGGRAPSGLADRARLEQEGIDTALRAMQQHAAQNGDVTYTVHGANGALARRYRRMAQERAEAAGFTFEETPSGGLIFRRADRDNRIDGNALQRALRDRMKRE